MGSPPSLAPIPLSLSVPLRFFLGKPAAQRTDLNQAGGIYLGTLLRYGTHRRGDAQGPVQYGVYRAAVPSLSAFLSLGEHRPGRLLDFNFELMSPIRGFRREVPVAGPGQG